MPSYTYQCQYIGNFHIIGLSNYGCTENSFGIVNVVERTSSFDNTQPTKTNIDIKSPASTNGIDNNTPEANTLTLDKAKTIAVIVSPIVGSASLIFGIYKFCWKKNNR